MFGSSTNYETLNPKNYALCQQARYGGRDADPSQPVVMGKYKMSMSLGSTGVHFRLLIWGFLSKPRFESWIAFLLKLGFLI